MDNLTDRELKQRLGIRPYDTEGHALGWVLPQYTINGAVARSGQTMKGLGKGHFVCLPNSSYRPTEAELKPFRDYIANQTPLVKGKSQIVRKSSDE